MSCSKLIYAKVIYFQRILPLQLLNAFLLWIVLFNVAQVAWADELRPSYLQLKEISTNTLDVQWRVPSGSGSDRFGLSVRFDEQSENLNTIVDNHRDDVNVQRWQVRRASGLSGIKIHIDGLIGTNLEVIARIEYLDGAVLTHRFTPVAPSFQVKDKPSILNTIWTYFGLGVEHILFGMDHLLFVLALLLMVRGLHNVVLTITAFTISHSITLIVAALGWVKIPVVPIEACIALSIVFVAIEIIHGLQGRQGITQRRPWLVAFFFGLLHGLGFAAALTEIGLPQNAILIALLIFNVGVEVGQLIFVFSVFSVWLALKPLLLKRQALYIKISAYGIGSLASFWLIERLANF